MYLRVDHWVPAMCRSLAAAIRCALTRTVRLFGKHRFGVICFVCLR